MNRIIEKEIRDTGIVIKKEYSYKYAISDDFYLFLKLVVHSAGVGEAEFKVDIETWDRYEILDNIPLIILEVDTPGRDTEYILKWNEDAGNLEEYVLVDADKYFQDKKDKELIKRFNLK